MKTIALTLASGFIAFIFMLIIVPVVKNLAIKINLTDKPNSRKLHQNPVPLIGGITIALTVLIVSLINYANYQINSQELIILSCGYVLLLVGIIDDKYDLSAKYKLLIQVFCSYAIAASGSRINSLYGLFGIYELNSYVQYAFTIVIICGVINAFNLMDGIDGLAGILSIIGFSFLGIFSFIINNTGFTLLFSIFLGAIAGFLKFNLKSEKIFMGDAGSLFIGTILIGSSVYFLNSNLQIITSKPILLYSAIGFFALPVLDSIRVYLGRLKKGVSPFKADKTHMHHLFLIMNISHKRIALIISGITFFILIFTLLLNYYISITTTLLLITTLFSAFCFLLNQNKKVHDWREKIKKLEQ